MKLSRWLQYPGVIAGVAAVYFLAGRLALMLPLSFPGTGPVWPPTGIALAALLVLGYRVWPGIFAGAFCLSLTDASNTMTLLGIAAGNTIEGLAGAWLTNRFARGSEFFERPLDVLKFAGLVAAVSLISPPIGATSLSLRNLTFWTGGISTGFIWWLADMLSVLVMTPLLVVWSTNPRVRWRRGQAFEFALLTVSLLLATEAVFGQLAPDSAQGYLLPYLCLPFLIWAAFRFGPRETTVVIFVLGAVALWGTLRGYGLFGRTVPEKALLSYQGFMIFNSVVALCVAAVVMQRRLAEDGLRQAHDELELRVQQRTEALRNEIAERRRAEGELRESEVRFRTMANAMPQLAWIANADGWLHWYNRRWYEYTGTTPERMEGWGWQSVHDPVELPKVLEKWKSSIATGEPFEMTFPLRGADGVFRLFLTRGFPLKDAAGRVTQWFGTNTDVSELKRTEEALRKSEATVRGILNATEESIWLFSPDGRILMGNATAFRRMGKPTEEIVGKHFHEFLPAELAEARLARVRQVVASKQSLSFEDERNGIEFHHNFYPVLDDEGRVNSIACFSRDITESKRAEEERERLLHQLAAEKDRWQATVESMPDPVTVCDAEGRATYMNTAYSHLLGRQIKPGVDLEKHAVEYQLYHADGTLFDPRDLPLQRAALSGKSVRNVELIQRGNDGSEHIVVWNAAPLHDATGRHTGAVAVGRDITAQRRAEEALSKANEEMKTANVQLLTEIAQRMRTEKELRQTAQDLERSNRDLEQFAYVASHDLQEPLRAVGGYVELLQHRFPDKLEDKALQYIAGAAAGAARMQTLITDLLAFSRVGTQGKAFAPADLNTLLRDTLNNLQAAIQTVHATVTSDPLPRLPVDATQIVQLFQNLIGNALKFHSQRPLEIHIGAQRQEGRWLFFVRDNGIGIEPQYFQRIFQVFQRLHTRKAFPGTGIGLAICKKIVERHGGTIWLESQPGQGSTFYFSIPKIAGKGEPAV